MVLVLMVILILVDVISAQRGISCPLPHLENGRTRGRRNIRFACKRDYQLMGAKYAHCVRGAWDVEMPVCVKPGCPRTNAQFVNGIFIETYRGAVVKVICDPGYETAGTSTVYCNGSRWNGTFPLCAADPSKSKKFCGFETEDTCGWSQENNQNLFWSREKYKNFSLTLPKIETNSNLGDKDEYFMHLEVPKTRRMTYPAKLYSPVYSTPNAQVICLSFRYFMTGDPKGTLKVFAKLEGRTLENSVPYFWITGELQNVWAKGFFEIEPTTKNFQVVFDGEADSFSDAYEISIDDVKLSLNEECNELISTVPETASVSEFQYDPGDDYTCRNRCNESAVLVGSDLTADDFDEEARCDCHSGCLNNLLNCCSDFHEVCLESGGNRTSEQTLSPFLPSISNELKITKSLVASNSNNMPNFLVSSSSTSPPLTSTTVPTLKSFQTTLKVALKVANVTSTILTTSKLTSLSPLNSKSKSTSKAANASVKTPIIATKAPIKMQTGVTTSTTVAPTTISPKLTVSYKITTKPSVIHKETLRLPTKPPTKATATTLPTTKLRTSSVLTKLSKTTPKPSSTKQTQSTTKRTTRSTLTSIRTSKVQLPTRLTTKATSTTIRTADESNDIHAHLGDIHKKQQDVVFNYYNPKSNRIPGTSQDAVKTEEKQVPSIQIPLSSIMEASFGIVILILVTTAIAVYVIKRRRRSDRESLVEDSDSILYGVPANGSEYTSLVCIKPSNRRPVTTL